MKRFWAAGSISEKKKCAEHVYDVFLTTALDRGEGSASPPNCFIPMETDPWVFAEKEAEWRIELVSTLWISKTPLFTTGNHTTITWNYTLSLCQLWYQGL